MASKETKRKIIGKRVRVSGREYYLVLYNDDIHSFDYVTEALMDVCGHAYEQAMQCTLIAHNKGSCDIRKGELKKLKKMKDALSAKDLSTTINPLQ